MNRAALLFALAMPVAPACTVGTTVEDGTAGAGLGLDNEDSGLQALTKGVCATGSTTLGVDVSYHDGAINWPKVKTAGVGFAFVRVSDGTQFKDPKFQSDWAGAKAAGILRGAYQFFRPSENVAAQAQLFITAVGAHQPGDLPPVLDVEVDGGLTPATVAARVKQWTDAVHAALGVAPIVYSGFYFWRDQVGAPGGFAGNPLWLAQYTSACPTVPSPWTQWTFWQYSDTGRVSGIPTAVDMNRFNGTLADLQAFAGAAVTSGSGSAGSGSDGGAGSGSGSGSGGAAMTCTSSTLAKDVPNGTCVQSAVDELWEQCNGGAWVTLASSVGCTVAYGFCESATVGRALPPRTCVQAAADHAWYQCDGHSWVQPTTSTSGPAGACSDAFPL